MLKQAVEDGFSFVKSRLKAVFYSSGLDLKSIAKVRVKVQGDQVYVRVPVHLLESQTNAVETLPDITSHICPPLQVDEVKSITHLLALSQSVALPFSS